MLGFTFYLEYPNKKAKRKGTTKKPGCHAGNVVAVLRDLYAVRQTNYNETHYFQPDNDSPNPHKLNLVKACRNEKKPVYDIIYDAVGALNFSPNSVVCGTQVSSDYLRHKAKRIPESLARKIHPNLFTYLDN